MNKAQEIGLKFAANALSRAEGRKNLNAISLAHTAVLKTITGIYKRRINVPTVLRVEEILNDGLANVLGKTHQAYAHIEMLAVQAETGLRIYKKFAEAPQTYVDYAEATRENVNVRGISVDGVPNEPVRHALGKFRSDILTDLTHKAGDPIPDREQTNRMRYDATVNAERDFLEAFLDNRKYLEKEEREEKKARHLRRFNNRLARECLQIEVS